MGNEEVNIQNETVVDNENHSKNDNKKKGSKTLIIIIILLIVVIALIGIGVYFLSSTKVKVENTKTYSPYSISGSSLQNFDLAFLQLENKESNKVYSPLSIKYALEMLSEGSKGNTKDQIDSIIGNYVARKYVNSSNMSFANAIFIRDSFKNSVEDDYENVLTSKYNAEVVYDSFNNANNLNSWVSNKTFNLINNLFDDISGKNLILTNALAIDMEWVNKIQSEHDSYREDYKHEDYIMVVEELATKGYTSLDFNNSTIKAKSVEIGASVNKYDIVNKLGEDNIRETVGNAYKKWLSEGGCGYTGNVTDEEVDTYLDQYIKEINSNYKKISSSTDFYFYDDDSVKVFAKDLKEYNGITLQYVGIMPKNNNLSDYIKNINAKQINNIIHNLKGMELSNFEDGVITKITGYIPMFKFDYTLDLKSDLKALGITDVFDSNKANISGITSLKNSYIDSANHKANIEFSNDGIKASAATEFGGLGDATCEFKYDYDVPVKEIDLTFDNSYLFLIRDKDTGEVWFAGTVYEPIEYQENSNNAN